MRRLLIGAALLASSSVSAASARETLYAEPAAGPRMTVENLKERKRVLGTDLYCIRDILVNGVKVFGGNRCRVKHGEKTALRLTPGRHELVFDTFSEWGTDDQPGVPPVALTATVRAAGKDLTVVLRGDEPPEVAATGEPAPDVSTGTSVSSGAASDPFKTLERLKKLHDEGVITDDEFKAKKAELLKSIH